MYWSRAFVPLAVLVLAGGLTRCSTFEEAKCDDNIINGLETDVDCGGQAPGVAGGCPACADGKGCLAVTDCQSGNCQLKTGQAGGTCQPSSCTDGIQNGAETGPDCGGGTCPTCGGGVGCKVNDDCASGRCDTTSTPFLCTAPSCTDTVQNQGETDVDCGGAAGCPTCDTGKKCDVGGDCTSGFCNDQKVCADAACSDGSKNGAETDVDCGGAPASGCNGCAVGKSCLANTDCASQNCNPTTTKCEVGFCENGSKDGQETDVDCGGATNGGTCDPCPNGKACLTGVDCASNSCQSLVCQPSSCTNGVQDGTETGLDCGGDCSNTPTPSTCTNACPKCPVGGGCTTANDCETNLKCINNTCVQ